MNRDTQSLISQSAKILEEAEALIITAGSGIGIDSGLPNYNDPNVFKNLFPKLGLENISFAQMANPAWFTKNPKRAWAFYASLKETYAQTEPHNGYEQLLELAKTKKEGYFIFTSNVDGHFQKAGFDPLRIEECHGSIHHLQCSFPCGDHTWQHGPDMPYHAENMELSVDPPTCPYCHSIARPNILLYSDWNWAESRTDEQGTRFSKWFQHVHKNKIPTAVIEVGAGTTIPTVRYQSERLSSALKTPLIRINPNNFDVPKDSIGLPLGAKTGINSIFGKL